MKEIRECDKIILEEAKNYPDELIRVTGDWYHDGYDLTGLKEVWFSKFFRVLIYMHFDRTERISVLKLVIDPETGEFDSNINWGELQNIKKQCGRGDKLAVEVFPREGDVMNFGSHRHLWVVEDQSYVWAKKKRRISLEDEIRPSDILRYSFNE